MSAHLDDEHLSNYLDGQIADAQVSVHLGDCAACSDRLAELRAVSEALGSSLDPPSTQRRETHIAAALAAADAAALAEQSKANKPDSSGRRRHTQLPRWLGAAAAVIVVGVGAAGLVRVASSHTTPKTSAASPSHAVTLGPSAGAPPGSVNGGTSEFSLAQAYVDAGELGAQSDIVALTTKVTGDLAVAHSPSARDQTALAARPPVLGPKAAGPPPPPRPPPPPCIAEAGAEASAKGVPTTGALLRAGVVWQGQQAVLWVLARPGTPQPSYQIEIMALPGCRPLASRTT